MAALDGRPFPEEYPTTPASFVLNGGIFAYWGYYDVAHGLDDAVARQAWEDGVEMLARNIHRWDTGYSTRYDLYPHPVANVASSMYHVLHVSQLRAMQRIAPRSELGDALGRWERYQASARCRKRLWRRKSSSACSCRETVPWRPGSLGWWAGVTDSPRPLLPASIRESRGASRKRSSAPTLRSRSRKGGTTARRGCGSGR